MRFSILFIAAGLAPAFAATIVIPNAQTSTPGNDSSGDLSGFKGDVHFQEVFGRGQFASIPGSLLITQYAYRAKPGDGPIDLTDTSLNIYMSTSMYAPNTAGSNTLITPNFATNLGPDNTLVLSAGPGTLVSSPGCAGPGPCPFDMVVTLSTPFLYNPSQGFLMIDTQIRGLNGGSSTGQFDVESFMPSGGPIADVNSETAGTGFPPTGTVELSSNIVQLTYTVAAPEPASFALALCSLGLLASIRRRQTGGKPQ